MIPKKLCLISYFILILDLICEVYGDEKSSLTFVIDDTFSMNDEINQVKHDVNSIFDTVMNSKQSQIEDFVLVTFNDLDTAYYISQPSQRYRLRAITKDRNVFKNALSSIVVNGGGACPEYSMSGIMEGIKNSRPQSTIYVFTDASAKDYSLYEEVKNLAVKKQTKVVFMLTGDCGSKSSTDYMVYHWLADATSGDVFDVGKGHIGKIIIDIIINIQGRRIVINEKKYPIGYGHSFNFNIDIKVKEPTVTVTGLNPTLVITGPDGRRPNTKTMVQINTVLIVKIVDPKVGIYTAVVGSGSETRVKVTARTEVIFKHGFATFKASSIKDTTTRPLPDVKSHIHIKVTDGNIILRTLAIIDNKSGKELKKIPLTVLNEKEKLYVTELEEMPTSLFKLAITGYDPETNEIITRVGSPIEPQPSRRDMTPPKAPEVSIVGTKVDVDYNGEISLTCKVSAYPAPSIVWTSSDGTVLDSKTSVVELPYDYINYLKLTHVTKPGTYYCKASNSVAKNKFSKIDVNPRSPFKIISTPQETTSVNYGKPTNIVCNIKATVPIKIKWFYQKNEKSLELSEINTSDKYTVSSDGSSLHIRFMDLDLVGKYTCKAYLVADESKKISYTSKVEINDLKSPEISISDKTVTIMNGERLLESCKANGIPKPTITWQFKPIKSNVFSTIAGQSEQIDKPNISYEGAGLYKCTATNVIGAQSRIIDVIVHGKPNITNVDSEYYGVTGDKVLKIPCDVTGVPEPTITWKHGDKVVTSDTKITLDKNALFIKNPTEKDSGNFTCEAKNKYGYATKNFEAKISDFIDIDEKLNSYIYLKPGESTKIKCLVPHSDPKSVRWYVNGEKTLVIGSYYSLKNANFSNDGNYTCRVNTDQGSESKNYVVDVGYKPSLIRPLTSPFVNWNGNKKETLDCNVQAKPRETVEWFYNGKILNSKASELPISGWGQYTCNVTNVHGSVQQTFNVTSTVCVIDRTVDKVQNTPLLVSNESKTWPKLDTENEFITVSRKQEISLACSTKDQPMNYFKSHPNTKTINVKCYKQDQFIVDGKRYKFQDLQCNEYVKPSLVNTKKPCMKNGETIEIGYKLDNGFLGVYEVCYSEADHRTLYTKVLMSDVNMWNIVEPSFKLNAGTETGKHDGVIVKCRYNQRRFVNPVDVAFGPAQIATLMDKYNTVPVHEPCEGSSKNSWSDVEEIIHNAMFTTDTFIVWTGASHYNSLGIPRYLWKVGKFDHDAFETIVYVNDPNPDSKDILCSKHTPDTLSDIADTHDKYTYSCSMDEFLNAFKVTLSDFKF